MSEPETYLSERQAEAVDLLAEGYTWREAAEEMGIESSTFESYMRVVREKRERSARTLVWLAARDRCELERELSREIKAMNARERDWEGEDLTRFAVDGSREVSRDSE